jgi:hypothetical protein
MFERARSVINIIFGLVTRLYLTSLFYVLLIPAFIFIFFTLNDSPIDPDSVTKVTVRGHHPFRTFFDIFSLFGFIAFVVYIKMEIWKRPFEALFISLFAVPVLFGYWYYIIQFGYGVECVKPIYWFPDALYFSYSSFTSVVFGDVVPVGDCRYLSVLESLLGVVVAGSIPAIIVAHLLGAKVDDNSPGASNNAYVRNRRMIVLNNRKRTRRH